MPKGVTHLIGYCREAVVGPVVGAACKVGNKKCANLCFLFQRTCGIKDFSFSYRCFSCRKFDDWVKTVSTDIPVLFSLQIQLP